MNLIESTINMSYQVIAIDSDDEKLITRLLSFGIAKGSIITPLHFSIKKSTLAILVQQSQIALRYSEASKIIIEAIND